MKTMSVPIGAAVLIFLAGCSSPSQFPTNGNHALKTQSEFGVLTAQPDVYKGQAMKFAGRMVSVESTNEGTLVLAEWLPYPKREYDGPEDSGMVPQGRFTVLYPGNLDADGSLNGNKFLAVGKIKTGQTKVEGSEASRELPQVHARCLHVWKTGNSEIDHLDNEYDVREETYCSES